MIKKISLILIFSFASTHATCVAAAISDDVQRELTSQNRDLQEKSKLTEEKFVEKPTIEVEKAAEETAAEEGPTFFVKKITVEGNTVISKEVIDRLKQAFENTQSSFKQIQYLSHIITNLYRSQGYVTSRAFVPPQTVQNDTVTIKVIEGKVGKVMVYDQRYFNAKSYQKRMKFDPQGHFRYQDLESSLYAINRLPDRSAKAYLIPGENVETSDIILKVKESNPMHVYYSGHNRGTKLTHRGRQSLHLDHNNFTGHDDVLNSNVTVAEENAYAGAGFSYSYPMETLPFTFDLSMSYAKTHIIGPLKSADIEGESLSFSPSLSYSLVERPQQNIDLSLSFDYINSISSAGSRQTSADRMRGITFGPKLMFQDAGGRTLFYPEVHLGMPGFMGGLDSIDPEASAPDTGNRYTYYTANLIRLQRLPESMVLLMRLGGQYSHEKLTSVLQYRAGGAYSVRGYPESEASGDNGWNAGLELSSPIYFLPKKTNVPNTKKSWYNALRVVTFLDTARTNLIERPLDTTVKNEMLIGTGFGFRLSLSEYMSGLIDFGFPVGDDSSDKNNMQVHFSVKMGF